MKEQEFNEWFDSLSLEEQEEYFVEQQSEYWIEEYKNYPELFY